MEIAVVVDHIHLLVHELYFVQNSGAGGTVDGFDHFVVDEEQILRQHNVEVDCEQIFIGIVPAKCVQYL